MKRYTPHKYKRLNDGLASALPFTSKCQVHPHTSLVVNLDAMAAAHFDSMDSCSCVLSPFGQFSGAEIVLWELGIIIRLRSFDVLDFLSKLILHFNLWYAGKRGSFIMTTDKTGKNYAQEYNSWVAQVHHEAAASQLAAGGSSATASPREQSTCDSYASSSDFDDSYDDSDNSYDDD